MEGTQRLTGVRLVGLTALLAISACRMIGSEAVERPAPSTRPSGAVASSATSSGFAPAYEPPSRSGNMAEYEQWGSSYRVLETSYGYDERGVASWYGDRFHGRPTSSGEPYDMHDLTAAHRTLPLPSWVRVTNLANGRSVVVKVNDRGPFADTDRRIIDLSYAAAVELGMVEVGTASVRVEAIQPWQYRTLEGIPR